MWKSIVWVWSISPFTYALSHVLVEGVFNDKKEFVDMTVHMRQDCEGGCNHITAAVASTTDHAEYEASRWPKFLPQLYQLWEGHPDPSQNVVCDLTVRKTGEEQWEYCCPHKGLK